MKTNVKSSTRGIKSGMTVKSKKFDTIDGFDIGNGWIQLSNRKYGMGSPKDIYIKTYKKGFLSVSIRTFPEARNGKGLIEVYGRDAERPDKGLVFLKEFDYNFEGSKKSERYADELMKKADGI